MPVGPRPPAPPGRPSGESFARKTITRLRRSYPQAKAPQRDAYAPGGGEGDSPDAMDVRQFIATAWESMEKENSPDGKAHDGGKEMDGPSSYGNARDAYQARSRPSRPTSRGSGGNAAANRRRPSSAAEGGGEGAGRGPLRPKSSPSGDDQGGGMRGVAAGTATRTLREKLAGLEEANQALEISTLMKDKEVIELRQRISDLETALMSDLQNQLTAGTSSPSPPPSWGALGRMDSEEMTPGKMNSPGFALVAEAAEKEQMERQVRQLQKELSATKENYETMSKDYEQLEATLQECDSQKRGFAARYAFCLIDADHDGLIDLRGAERYELFAPYAHSVLERCFGMWEFTSGARGQMTLDDFLKFVYFAEEKTCKEAMNFWFRVIDIDGDGVWGRHDLLWFYQQVDKSGGCIAFDDFFCQITDMCDPEDPFQGITQRDVSTGGLGAGIIGLVVNHNNMLLQRTTAEWGRGNYPL